MKDFNFLMKNTNLESAVWNDGRTTVNRQSTDGQSQRQYSVGTIARPLPDSVSNPCRVRVLDYPQGISGLFSSLFSGLFFARAWKHVAMIFAVLVMSIANVSMAWADQAYHSVTPNICGTAYEMYGLKQEIWKSNTTVQDAYSSWVTYDINGNSGTSVSAPSGWLNGSSGKPGYGLITVRAAKPAYLYVTNCTGVAILTKGVSGDTKKPILSVKDASTNTEVDAEVSTTATDWTVLSYGAELDPGKRYIIKLYATTADNASVSQIRLTAPAVCSAGLSGVTSNPSATTGSSAGTITCGVSNGTAASATSYQWYKTTSNKASASSISGATSSSYSPNEASDGTYYYYCEVTTTQRDLSGATGSCKVETELSGAFVFTAAPEPGCEDVDAPTSLSCTAHTQTSLTFGWTKASDASGYVAKLWDNSSCTGDAVATENIANGNTETVTFSGLTAGTTYYCNVQSKGDGTDFCEDGGTTSAANGTTDACTAISPTWSYPFSTVAVGITIYPTIGGNTGGGAVTYSSSAASKITNDCYATAAGSATLTANVAANGVYCSGSVTSGTITVVADQSGLIKQTLTTGNNEWGTPSAPATTDGTNITSTTVLSATNLTISGNGNTSNGGQTAKITGMTTGSEGDNSGKYMQMGFTVKSGKQLNVSAIYIPVQPVSSDVNNIKAVLSDGETTITGTLTNSKNGKLAYIKFDSYGIVKGNVTLTLYAWGWTGGYRLGKSIVIDGEIEDAPSSCTAPNHVDVTPTAEAGNYGWRYTIGETLKLTATPYSSEGTSSPITSGITGYQWQKYVGNEWVNLSNGGDISGATSANLVISNLTSSNGGSYRCVISTGATCSTASTGYWVRVFTLNGNYYNSAWTENPIVWSSEYVGVATVSLNASSTYMFKVYDNDGKYFGSGSGNYIIEDGDEKDCGTGNADIRLFTGPAGSYTFTVDVTNAAVSSPYVNVVTNYPSVTHPAVGYMYITKWWDCYPHWWDGSSNALTSDGNDPKITKYTTICGTDYWYMPVLDNYTNVYFKDNATWGSAGNHGEETSSTGNSGKYYTHDGSSWGWHDFTTYSISFAGNGNTGGTMSSITGICPNSSQAITANAFEKTGYTFNCWHANVAVNVGGSTISAGGDIAGGATLQEINNDITLTAQWSPIPVTSITVSPASKTLDVGGTQTLTATVAPATALDKAVTWSTSNGSIATVNESGVVTAVAPGSATITATAHDGSGVTGTCSITVNKITPTKYSFSVDKTTLCGGETATLTLEDSEDGVTYELRSDATHSIVDTQKAGTGSALTWTGLGAGTYVVYAVADATYTERQMDGSKITVTAATATSITTQPTNQEVTVGEEATLTVVAAGTSLTYQWKESATEDGTYSNVASGGTSASYSVTPAAAGTKWYKCVVTGTCGTVTTDACNIVANAAKITPTVTWTTVPSTVYKGGKYAIEVSTNTDASLVASNLTCTNGTLSGVAVSDGVFTGYLEIATNASSAPTLTLTTSAGSTYAAKTETNDDIELGSCEGGGGSTIYSYTITSTSNVTGGSATGGSVDIIGLASDGTSTYGGVDYYKIGGNFSTSNRHIKITLSATTLAAGDVITLFDAVTSNNAGTFILYDSEGTSRHTYGNISTKDEVTEQKYTVTAGDGLVGSSVFYIGRNGSNGRIRTITITRPGGGSSQTTNLTWSGGLVDGGSVDKTVGDANFTYTASSNNSNGAISYSSGTTSVATINISTGEVTIVSAGSTTITATIAESGCYPTKSITYTLTVTATCTPVDAPTGLTCSGHTSSSLTFTWTKAANASGYTASLYNNSGCTGDPLASQNLGDVATVTFSTLTAETTYYCKIQSHGDGSTYCTAGGTTSAQSGTTDAACTAHGLAYGTAAVAKNEGDAAFTNTLTNPNSLAVTYSSSVTGVATVNPTSGMVTIVSDGTTVITATWAGDATYCAGTATYTLTVSSDCTPQSLVKTQLTSTNAGTTTGYNDGQYAGDPVIASFQKTPIDGGYKMTGSAKLFVTIKGGFVADDKINIVITQASDLSYTTGKLPIFYDASSPKLLTTIDAASAGTYTYTLTASDITTLGSVKTIGVYRSSGSTENNPYVKSVEVEGCREWATCTAPDAIAVGSVTGDGATFTITDALNTNNYEIYYSTSSTTPTAETSATVSGISTKSRAVTGLTSETTYYYWVRSNCGGATKSSWVAGTPASFTTEAAAATHSVTYNGNGASSGSVPTDATAYEEGDVVTVLGNTGSLVKTGQTFLGWSTSATASSGTFYPAGYKFYMPNAAVTLYAVWGSGSDCITITDFETSSHNNSSNNPDSEGKYFYGYKGTKDAAHAVTITAVNGDCIGQNSGANLKVYGGKYVNIYADNTTTGGTPSTFTNVTSVSIKAKVLNASYIATFDIMVGSTTIADNVSLSAATSAFQTYSYSGLNNLSGKIKIINNNGGSSSYSFLVDDIEICTGSGVSGHTVSFDMNGYGSAIADIANVPSGSKISAPVPSPTAVGVEFGGWYREAGCTNAWNFGSSTISKDTTLYAKWTTCAPSISAHPVAAIYTQDADATALSVTASGEGLNYQWYTSEDGSADIQGSSAIPGAISASYTPSTSLLGTIYYFCVVSNTCGNAVSNKAAITISDGRPTPTANWTIEEPKEGGKGFTFSIEVNKGDGTNWDGELIASMLTLSDNAILDGASIVVNNTNKTISGTYGVKAGSSSPVTFYLLLPATATQSATRLDQDRTFSTCAGGAGDSYNVPVRKDYEKDASNNYRWVTLGAGEITYAVSSSISSAKASSTVASVFDYIMSNDKQYVWVKTYEANTKTIRLYVETSGANVSVNTLYKNTVYATAADKDIVSSDDYTVSYDGSGTAENTGAKGTHYMDITFDSPLAANDIICVKFSSSKVKAYGAVLTTVGDGGDQTTGLSWSNSQASGAIVVKREDDADFTITAVRDATALKSLGLISYTSSNAAIATIDGATGLVHIADNIDFGSDEFKTTTITATLAASGCYKKAVITYILKVTKHVCEDTPGTITYEDRGCSGMDLTLEGYEEGATIKWYKNGTEIPSATSATYNATEPGEYYAVTHKTCDITSTNSITLEAATATAEKIVDSWYVKNGRRTPDIALVHTTGATSFTVTSGGTITEIGGCTFELKDDGIIYLHGQKEDGSAPSDMTAGDMTITITVSGCAGALSGLDITIHKQAETAKPSVAFVVDGTLRKDGGTATSVSTAKTSDRPLWTYLSSSYALTGCNVYWSVDSKELREYYSQFDAILITDDPNTLTNGTGGVPYVKAFGTMVDVRPILTMEAYVGRYSDGGWHVYNADPSSPNPRQVEMKLECKNHDIFKGLDPETSDNVRVTRDEYDNEYWHVIMVDTTVAPYHNTSKDYKALPALQGFDPHKFDHMLGVGTIAEETLQGGVERQEEPAARMMILGIQNEAMAALTNEGKLIIKNALDYLLHTNMEDVNDCANYFTDETGDHLWSTPGNWSRDEVPDFETRARILKPVVINNTTNTHVARVDIATSGKSKWIDYETCTGKVTITSTGALVVNGEVRSADAPHFGIEDLKPTTPSDLAIESSSAGNGTLIFDNSDGDTQASVQMYSKAQADTENYSAAASTWQYIGVPYSDVNNALYNYYDSWLYSWSPSNGWEVVQTGGAVTPWTGYCITHPDAGHIYQMEGTLVETGEVDINVPDDAYQIIGNSWTAPIYIAAMEDDDFGDMAKTIYFFNTGSDVNGEGTITENATGSDRWAPGTYVSVPIHSSPFTGDSLISSMQGFYVANTSGSEATLHLDYEKLVRPKKSTQNVLAGEMHAPKRVRTYAERPVVAKLTVSGSRYDDKLVVLEREDFSKGNDDGWDGEKWDGSTVSPTVWSMNEEGGAEAVTATPDMDGTVIGFRAGEDDIYTFHFEYDGYDEPLYLLDTETKIFTRVLTGNIYTFMCTDKRENNRFLLTRKNAQDAPTDNADIRDEYSKPLKFLNNDKIYIYVRGVLYDITGKIVK